MNRRKKLIWQLFPSYLLITLLSVLAVSWYASSALRHFFLEQTATDLETRVSDMQAVADRLYQRWLQPLLNG